MENIQALRKLLLLLTLFVFYSFCFSQVTEQWVRMYNGPGNGHDQATSLAVDASGNVYVTGFSFNSNGLLDITTIKYDPSGNKLWERRHDATGNAIIPLFIAVDANGDVYVAGSGFTNEARIFFDYITIKYDSNGNELWVKSYNGTGNFTDQVQSLAVDVLGNVYVTGESDGNGTGRDYATVKYDTNGNELWVKRYNAPGNDLDVANSVAVDLSGNVYVTGTSFGSEGGDFATIKYDGEGNEIWVKRYKAIGNALSLAVDAQGNVYVTGQSDGGTYPLFNPDYATVKYDTNGNELWVKRYDGNSIDAPTSLAVDGFGNVYVTGYSFIELNRDYTTIKYDTDGNELWLRKYSGSAIHRENIPNDIVVDEVGNVYVTGQSSEQNSSYDYATIKYDTNGNEKWVKNYNGTANYLDRAFSIAVDANGNVYVTGESISNITEEGVTNNDYATIKYTQTVGPVVSSFTLVNADTDQDIGELKDGDVIDLAALPNTKLNIRANTNPPGVGSVVFDLTWEGQVVHRADNTAPYAFIRYDIDNTPQDKNDYHGVIPSVGDYILTATPYSGPDVSGQKGTAYTIAFKVVNTSPTTNIPKRTEVAQLMEVEQRFQVSVAPNPVSTVARLQYELPNDGEVTIKVYDVVGREVTTVVQEERKAGMYYGNLNTTDLAKGMYYYRAVFTTTQKKAYIQTGKIVVVK